MTSQKIPLATKEFIFSIAMKSHLKMFLFFIFV